MTFIMYDTITVETVPNDPVAVAGYVGGHWPTYWPLVHRFPKAKHLSIAVFASEDAECLDVEAGDATPSQAGPWVQRQLARGVKRPCLYASVSAMSEVLANLRAHGIPRTQVRLWTAHYGLGPHLCPDCGFGFGSRADATQYTSAALGRNLDASLCLDNFFGIHTPKPLIPHEENMISAVVNHNGRLEVFVEDKNGQVWHTWQEDNHGNWAGSQAGIRTAEWYRLGPPVK